MKDKQVKITVIATMSSGKSTTINALIGEDLLPANNMACTSKITEIIDNDKKKNFSATTLDSDSKIIKKFKNIDAKLLEIFNKDNSVNRLVLEGNLPGVKNYKGKKIVFIDTPGPNNSIDKNHGAVLDDLIEKQQDNLILYIINATQFGINDDNTLLNKISETLENKDITDNNYLFLLNKIDELDDEIDGDISYFVEKCKVYIESIGIEKPNIVPVSSYAALLFKMVLRGHKLTKKQTKDFINFYDLFFNEGFNLNKECIVSNKNVSTRVQSLKYRKSRLYAVKYFGFSKIKIRNKAYKVKDIFTALKNTGLLFIEEYFTDIVQTHIIEK